MQPTFSQNHVAGFNDRKDSVVARFYEAYYPVILDKVKTITGASPESEDLVSDIWVKILKHPGKFETVEKIKNFTKEVAKTTCIDYLDKRERREELKEELTRRLQRLDEYNETAAIVENAFQSIIYLAIEKLPQQAKCIFLLFYLQNLKNQEIARIMGIKEKTVKNQKLTALKKLKLEMERQGIHNREALLKWVALFWWLSQFLN